MRLIDAEQLWMVTEGDHEFYERFEVENAPTIDAEPVRQGHWEFHPKDAFEAMFTLPMCSSCGFKSADGGRFCSNCGAKMDEEVMTDG